MMRRTWILAVTVASVTTWSAPAAALLKTYTTKGTVFEFNPSAGDGTARPMISSGIMGALGCGAKAIGLGDEQKLLSRCQQVTAQTSTWFEKCDPAGLVVALKERYSQNWVFGALGTQETAFAEMINAAALYGAPSMVPLFGQTDRWATLVKFTVDLGLDWMILSKVYFYSSIFDAETQMHDDGLYITSGNVFRNTYYKLLNDPALSVNDPFRGRYVFAHDPPVGAAEPAAEPSVELDPDPARGSPLIGESDMMTEELAEALVFDALDLEGLLGTVEFARIRQSGVPHGAWAVDGLREDGTAWRYFIVPVVEVETGDALAYVGLSAENGAFEQVYVPRTPERVQWTTPQDAAALAMKHTGRTGTISGGALRWSPCEAGEGCGVPLRPRYEFTVGEGDTRRIVRVPLVHLPGANLTAEIRGDG